MIQVPLLNPKFATPLPHGTCELRVRGTCDVAVGRIRRYRIDRAGAALLASLMVNTLDALCERYPKERPVHPRFSFHVRML